MPAHKGPLTLADLISVTFAFLWIVQPGVDRRAVFDWILNNIFGGDLRNMRLLSTQLMMKTIEWGSIAIYTFLYWAEIPIIERFRAYPPASGWPWKSPDPKVRAEYRALQWSAFWYIVKFHAVVLSIEAIRYFWTDPVAGPGQRYEDDPAYTVFLPDNVPTAWTSLWQIVVGTIIGETGFYFGHRLLHSSPFWYRHHKWHHEFVDTGVLTTFYVHPIDALITDLIPMGIAIFALKMHAYTMWLFIIPHLLNAVWVHCGYTHPLRFNPLLALPLSTESERTHDLHHRNSLYNFGGAYFVWDRLLGTYRDPDTHWPAFYKRGGKSVIGATGPTDESAADATAGAAAATEEQPNATAVSPRKSVKAE